MKKILTPLLIATLVVTAACSSKKEKKKEAATTAQTSFSTPVTQEGLDKMTETWPESSKAAIKSLTSKYGLPNAVTEEMVVWTNTGSFKKSIIYKEEVNHSFPLQHMDVLQQTVDYRVPLDKVSEVAKFDGSVLVDRVKGEVSARNDKEEMNILALNLTDKIVRGEMTVEQARREFAKNAEAFVAGTSGPMLTSLNFKAQGNTTDPDTMMQSQEASQPKAKAAPQSKQVEEVIEEEQKTEE